MKKSFRITVFTIIMMMLFTISGSAAVVKQADVTKASSGCVLAGIRGSYIVDSQNALNRLNAIRLEACKEHVKNPATGKALTEKDYVPLKWSNDMEYIARIRAAESSLTMGHVRANGKQWYDIKSPNKKESYCEVIAWNYSTEVLKGIEQWYAEKNAWVKRTGGVTGHYEAIINPQYRYVGIGTFYSKNVNYYNTTVGEFTATKSGLSTKQEAGISDVVQMLNVKTSYYNKFKNAFVETKASASSETKAGTDVKTASVTLTKTSKINLNATSVKIKKKKKYTLKATVEPKTSKEKVTFKSSKTSVATVSSKGVITGKKAGTATITVTSGKVKRTVKVVVK